jgi:hypothetical protein
MIGKHLRKFVTALYRSLLHRLLFSRRLVAASPTNVPFVYFPDLSTASATTISTGLPADSSLNSPLDSGLGLYLDSTGSSSSLYTIGTDRRESTHHHKSSYVEYLYVEAFTWRLLCHCLAMVFTEPFPSNCCLYYFHTLVLIKYANMFSSLFLECWRPYYFYIFHLLTAV